MKATFEFEEIEAIDRPHHSKEDRNLYYTFESKDYLGFTKALKEIVLGKSIIDLEKIIIFEIAKHPVDTITRNVGSTVSAALFYESKDGISGDVVNVGDSPVHALEYDGDNKQIGERQELETEHGLDSKKHPNEVARFKPEQIENKRLHYQSSGISLGSINMSRALGDTSDKAYIPQLTAQPSINFWHSSAEAKKLVVTVATDGVDPRKLQSPTSAMKILYPETFPVKKFDDSDIDQLRSLDWGYAYGDDLTVLRLRIEQKSEKVESKESPNTIRCLLVADGHGNKAYESLGDFSIAQMIVDHWRQVLENNIKLVHELFATSSEAELNRVNGYLKLLAQFQGNYPNIVLALEGREQKISDRNFVSQGARWGLALLGQGVSGATKKAAVSNMKKFFQNQDVELTPAEINIIFEPKSKTSQALAKFGITAEIFKQLYDNRKIFSPKKPDAKPQQQPVKK